MSVVVLNFTFLFHMILKYLSYMVFSQESVILNFKCTMTSGAPGHFGGYMEHEQIYIDVAKIFPSVEGPEFYITS